MEILNCCRRSATKPSSPTGWEAPARWTKTTAPVQGIIGGQGGASFPLDRQVKREDASPSTSGVGGRPGSLQLGDRTA